MRIAITGATGNLGTALIRRLLASDERTEIIGLARRVPRCEEAGTGDRPRWAQVDLVDPTCVPTLRSAFRDADAVVHLAWGFQPSHDPAYLEELGICGTRRVLEAARSEEVPHLVHMSSVGAYSAKVDDVPVDESYPTDGIASSPYSSHKSTAERLLDAHEARGRAGTGSGPRITRIRPGIVGQRSAGSALLRYGLPGLVPGRAITLLPVLPMDRDVIIPMIHADDVADAVERVVSRKAFGAFNLAAPLPVTPPLIAGVLGARFVHVPARHLRSAVDATWRARLQPLDPGWVDLAMKVPLLDTGRAESELEWSPAHSAEQVLLETIAGMRDSAAGATPVLRSRSVVGNLRARVRHGAISKRREP